MTYCPTKKIGRATLRQFATIVTPDTLLAGTDASSPESTTAPPGENRDDREFKVISNGSF
jgi:hypothetical protein